MPKGIFALNGAPKVRRIARIMFWLAFISAASRHDILLGVVLYPIAALTVLAIGTCWLWMPGLLWLAWYWHRHHRLPGWLSRRLPARLRRASVRRMFRQARGRLMDVFPGHSRRVRRRWPRHPQSWETSTDEPGAARPSEAGTTSGRAAAWCRVRSRARSAAAAQTTGLSSPMDTHGRGNPHQGDAASFSINPQDLSRRN